MQVSTGSVTLCGVTTTSFGGYERKCTVLASNAMEQIVRGNARGPTDFVLRDVGVEDCRDRQP
jgi:hypothetical protein